MRKEVTNLMFRCMVCARLWLLHLPWQRARCENTPLPIELTEPGELVTASSTEAAWLPPAANA